MVASQTLSDIFQINIRGINPKVQRQKIKFAMLKEYVTTCVNKIPFFIVTETHFSADIIDAEISIPDYNVIRADRATRKCGGVAIYHHYLLNMDCTETFSNDYCECVMTYNGQNSLIIIGLYRPPDTPSSVFKETLKKVQDFISKYPKDSILMLGDFNLKFINWEKESIEKPINIKQNISSDERISSNMLLDFVNENMLTQLVKENTRYDKSLLDLVLTNNEDIVFEVTVKLNDYKSDHDTVYCQIHLKDLNSNYKTDSPQNTEKQPLDKLYFEKANWDNIRNELSAVKWDEIFLNKSVEEMYLLLEEYIINISERHVPLRKRKGHKRSIPPNRLKLIRKRKELTTRINIIKYTSKTKDNEKLEKLIKRRQEVEDQIFTLLENEMFQREINAIENMKKNPKYFYSYVKKFNQVVSKIGPLKDAQGNLNNEPETKANLLQDQYTKVFSNPENANPNVENKNVNLEEIHDFDISLKDITSAIKDIPINAAPGPDKIPAILLKECSNQLAKPLQLLWQKSLDTSDIPHQLKTQTIIPLFKKGPKSLAENYRPVSLTSHIIKLFERIVRKIIVKHIEKYNLLSKNQHAFIVGRSCQSQLLEHIDYVINSVQSNKNVDVVYLDFAKAFDKVDHKILLQKIESFGIKGKIYNWIKNFIENRNQQVLVEGILSRKEKVVSGVPQGTVLGPVLFLIYIDDLEESLKHSLLRIFADDSKIVKDIENREDHQLLQEDINLAVKWSRDNNMELNKKKFQLMQYGTKNELKLPYDIGQETPLEKEQDIKDLGVYVSENLSWETHIAESVKRGRKCMGWILRTFKSRKAEVLLTLYRSYVIPLLEYASVLWTPYKIKDIIKMESIQRSITAKIEGLKHLNYHQRLRALKLFSLQRRRERYSAIYVYKIAMNLVPNNLNLQFYTTSRHGLKCRLLKIPATHIGTVRKNSSISAGPSLFNVLPSEIKEAVSIEQFKSRLDKFLISIPDLPPTHGYSAINKNTILEWVTGNYDYKQIIETLAEVSVRSQPERGSAVSKPDRS